MIRRLSATLLVCAACSAPLHAAGKVLAALPVTYGLGEALLAQTHVQLERAAPERLPASRQPSYFFGRGAASLQEAAADADAVLVLRSIWPQDPLYPLARRSNLRIVEIDAARPVDGALPGIALQAEEGDTLARQPWLAPSNLGRMADILAADLIRLSPPDAERIEANLAQFKQRVLKLTADAQMRLAQADVLTVSDLSGGFDYLIDGLQLERIPLSGPSAEGWSEDDLAQLRSELEDNDVALVLVAQPPSPDVRSTIEAAGSKVLQLQTEHQGPLQELESLSEQLLNALAG